MRIKIEEIVPFSRAVKVMYDANKVAIVAYDESFADPFETEVWDLQIAAVDGIISTGSSIILNATKTREMHGFMRGARPILKNLQYKISQCIADGTIEDSLESFDITGFLNSITNKQIGVFHISYTALYAKINEVDIASALDDVGFTSVEILSLKTQHNLAWNMSDAKTALKGDIHALSASNQVVINTLLDTNQRVVDVMHAKAETDGNADWIKRSTSVAILKTVRATPTKKPRNRKVKKTSFIKFRTHFVARDTIQGKVTSKESLYIVQSNTLVGPYTGGMELVHGVEFNLKKHMIPGVGKYIIVYNPSNHVNGVFEVLIIKG
ncbi:MAG: hypothetical protein WCL14_08700 [Bacteroidota bacterium]